MIIVKGSQSRSITIEINFNTCKELKEDIINFLSTTYQELRNQGPKANMTKKSRAKESCLSKSRDLRKAH